MPFGIGKSKSIKKSADVDWVSDGVYGFLLSPMWSYPICSYIETNCPIFEDEEENKLEYTTIHNGYKALVEDVLEHYINDISMDVREFVKVCARGDPYDKNIWVNYTVLEQVGGPNKALNCPGQFSMDVREFVKVCARGDPYDKNIWVNYTVLEQVWAAENFLLFKQLMLRKNFELQQEAINILKEREHYQEPYSPSAPSNADFDPIQTQKMIELSEIQNEKIKVMHERQRLELMRVLDMSMKESQDFQALMEKEKRDLEEAIRRSLVVSCPNDDDINIQQTNVYETNLPYEGQFVPSFSKNNIYPMLNAMGQYLPQHIPHSEFNQKPKTEPRFGNDVIKCRVTTDVVDQPQKNYLDEDVPDTTREIAEVERQSPLFTNAGSRDAALMDVESNFGIEKTNRDKGRRQMRKDKRPDAVDVEEATVKSKVGSSTLQFGESTFSFDDNEIYPDEKHESSGYKPKRRGNKSLDVGIEDDAFDRYIGRRRIDKVGYISELPPISPNKSSARKVGLDMEAAGIDLGGYFKPVSRGSYWDNQSDNETKPERVTVSRQKNEIITMRKVAREKELIESLPTPPQIQPPPQDTRAKVSDENKVLLRKALAEKLKREVVRAT